MFLSGYFVFQGALITTNVAPTASRSEDAYRDLVQALVLGARAAPLRVGDQHHILLHSDGKHLSAANVSTFLQQREAFVYVFDVEMLNSSPGDALVLRPYVALLSSTVTAALSEEIVADEQLSQVCNELEAGRQALERHIMTELESSKMAVYGAFAVSNNLAGWESAAQARYTKAQLVCGGFLQRYSDTIAQLPAAFEMMKSLEFNPHHLGLEYANDNPVSLLQLLSLSRSEINQVYIDNLVQHGQSLHHELTDALAQYRTKVEAATGPRQADFKLVVQGIQQQRDKAKEEAARLLKEQEQEIKSLEQSAVATREQLRSLKERHERLREIAELVLNIKVEACVKAQESVKEVTDRQRQLSKLKETGMEPLTKPGNEAQVHHRECCKVVRLPHATVAMLAEVKRREKFKAAFLELTNNYNQALKSIAAAEYEARNNYLQIHHPYTTQWPAAATLCDGPDIQPPIFKDFDRALPDTHNLDFEALLNTLQTSAENSSYKAWMETVPALPAFSRAAFDANQHQHSTPVVDEDAASSAGADAELQAEVDRLRLEVLALHAECYLLSVPEEEARRVAHRTANLQSTTPPPPLSLNLQTPATMTASILSPIPEQSADEVERSVSETTEATSASSPHELQQCRQDLQRVELEKAELEAQLETLQVACDGLQQQLEQVDLEQAEQDLEASRIGRTSSVIATSATTQSSDAATQSVPASPAVQSSTAQTPKMTRQAAESQTEAPAQLETSQVLSTSFDGDKAQLSKSPSNVSLGPAASFDITKEPLHLAVVGVKGRPQSGSAIYLLGCRGENNQWYTVALCGSKLSKAEGVVSSKMQPLSPDDELPAWLQLGAAKNRPNFILKDPTAYPAVQVFGAEISQSHGFAAGFTIRFPKIHAVAVKPSALKKVISLEALQSLQLPMVADESEPDSMVQAALASPTPGALPRLSFLSFEVGSLALFVPWSKDRSSMVAFRRGQLPYHILPAAQCKRYGLITKQHDGKFKQEVSLFVGRMTKLNRKVASGQSKYSFVEGTTYFEVEVERWTRD
eukprot:m.141613 g.141613  ORF g.141613 m.141613 type:complete len:1036 (-) comp16132_c0_seq1:1500-4607(-)